MLKLFEYNNMDLPVASLLLMVTLPPSENGAVNKAQNVQNTVVIEYFILRDVKRSLTTLIALLVIHFSDSRMSGG